MAQPYSTKKAVPTVKVVALVSADKGKKMVYCIGDPIPTDVDGNPYFRNVQVGTVGDHEHWRLIETNPQYRAENGIMELETLLEPAHYQPPETPESQGKPPKLVYHGRMRDLKDELDQTKAQVLHLQKKLSERKPRQEPSGF